MPVKPGQILSHYRLVEKIGEGGMGVVWKALDTTLDRDVAIKILPDVFAQDAERLARFEREAKLLASLNHPNIAAIYGLDKANGLQFLAMELVSGEDLSRRLSRGSIPLEETLTLCRQVAEALEAAHEKGIIHRDLKPANVKVTPDGKVKVLDFGLAKALEVEASGTDPSASPTITSTRTRAGVLLGTAAYMSPEQSRGKPLDKRTDIWSFGCLLYECLTGKRAFPGETVSDSIAAILKTEPDWSALPVETSTKIRELLRRCLQKDPHTRLHDIADARIEIAEAVAASAPSAAAVTMEPSRPVRSRRLAWAAVTVIAALVVVVVYFVWPRISAPRAPSSGKIMLAVLPFDNLGGDPEQEYFSDGMTEEMIAQLGRLQPEQLGVIARTSAMHYKKTDKGIGQIGQELGVDYILEGSVRRQADRVRITAQLIQVSDRTHLWAETYERELADVFAIQSEVARDIAKSLVVGLLPAQQAGLAASRQVNPEAYEAYLKGRFHWNKRTGKDIEKAIDYFQQAVGRDPSYALAYVGLAESYAVLPDYSDTPPEEAYSKAREAATRAIEMDDTLAEAYASLAMVSRHRRRWSAAEQEFKRAIQLNPAHATAHHWYAFYLMFMGRHDESIAEIERARKLDPLSLIINANTGYMLYHARRYDQAIERYLKTIGMDPNFGEVHKYLGLAYEQKGMYPEAIAEIQKSITLSGPSSGSLASLGHAHAVAGSMDEARKVIYELKRQAKSSYVPSSGLALVYAGLGDKAEAFAWLERAYEEQDDRLSYLGVEPRWDPLRSDPRFQDLMRRVGLPTD